MPVLQRLQHAAWHARRVDAALLQPLSHTPLKRPIHADLSTNTTRGGTHCRMSIVLLPTRHSCRAMPGVQIVTHLVQQLRPLSTVQLHEELGTHGARVEPGHGLGCGPLQVDQVALAQQPQ